MPGHKETHAILIRKMPDDLYERLWALRKAKRARSWVHLLQILCEESESVVKQEWL